MSKYQKVTVKPTVIAAVVGFFVVLIVLILALTPSAESTLASDYNLSKDHDFEVTSINKLNKKIDKEEDFILIVGSPTCSVCVEGMPHYNRYFNENNEELSPSIGNKLLYLNAGNSGVYQFLISNNIIVPTEDGNFGTPQVVYFKNGKLSVSLESAIGETVRLRVIDFYNQVLKKI